jgi:nitroreductase
METMKAILTRRSVRRYEPRPVPAEALDAVLEAAMCAPSAGNEAPWRFVVIEDRKLLGAVPSFHPNARMMAEAPVAIAVCGDLSLLKYEGFWVQDLSAATQNILLAAHDAGLGAVWVGIYPREDRVAAVRSLLGLPEGVVPFAIVPLGYPAVKKEAPRRWDRSRVHRNRYPEPY